MDFDGTGELILADLDLTLCFSFLLTNRFDDYIELDTCLVFVCKLVFNNRLGNNFLRLAFILMPIIIDSFS